MMKYNIRVYGIVLNASKEVLLSDEVYAGRRFTKFPGGGHIPGEGLADTLMREFQEEMQIQVRVGQHLYTNTDLVVSAFASQQQLIAHYYQVFPLDIQAVPAVNVPFNFSDDVTEAQSFRWFPVAQLQENHLTFPIDKRLVQLLKNLV
jgi:8-oxo-dGTP diphosphatase